MIQAALLVFALEGAVEVVPPRELGRGIYLIEGAVPPERGPDGNTIVFHGREGLIVVDTGRHAWHSDAILAFAQARGRPIASIVNTHWHLDHSSGNRRIKAQFPRARLYATSAIDRALGPQGFLTRNLATAPRDLNDPNLTAAQQDDVLLFIETMAARESLRPDIAIARTGGMRIGGRRFDVHVANGAVTDADLWLYDRRSRIAVLGDLVTFPAPFFETACPDQWSAALAAVWDTPFELAVPGHGPPMTRTQFGAYRSAFDAFMACVRSDAAAGACARGWARAAEAIVHAPLPDAFGYADYYAGFLRANGAKSPDCLSS